MSGPAIEVEIPIQWDDAKGIITNLFRNGEAVTDPRDASVAVGLYLTGRNAGLWFVLDELDGLQLELPPPKTLQ